MGIHGFSRLNVWWMRLGIQHQRIQPGQRPYPAQLPPQEYPGHYVVKKVTTGGTFRFRHRLLFLATSLTGHHIGLDETDDGIWSLYFNTVLVAKLGERDYIICG